MLNVAQDKKEQEILPFKKLEISDIEKFYSGRKQEFLVGLEYERLSLDKDTFKNASYEKLEKIILRFCEITAWKPIYDIEIIIGANDSFGNTISLEPGCQLEISIAPKKDILSIELEITKIIELLDNIANVYNVLFFGYGISPVSSCDDIELLKKRRYLVMNSYLPNCPNSELFPKMMRQTAGFQINVDYRDSKDAYYKLKFLNLIMPFMAGLSANSPFEQKMNDKKSIRCHVWRFCGENRCKMFYKNVFGGFFAKNNLIKRYINTVLDVPMVFIERNGEIIDISGKITFKQFMKNGYLDNFATLDDYILHQSLCFPDVRFKKCIEIRNHDSSDYKTALAFCAFYKGILKNDIKKLLKKISFLKIDNIDKYNQNIIVEGLNYQINNQYCGWDIVDILLDLAKANLVSRERAYLEPILIMAKERKTNADLIIENGYANPVDIAEFLY